MIYKYHFICILLSVSLITSCAKKEEVSSSVSAPLVGGVWLSNCNYDSTAKGVLFDGLEFNDAVIYFTDNSCSTVTYIEERIGTYSVSAADQSPPQLFAAGDYDKIVEDYAITPVTSAAAVSMNSSSKCGFTNWASGTLKVVTGHDCGSGVLAAGVAEYDRYSYALADFSALGRQAGDLLFGYFDSAHDGTTPAKRPEGTYGNYVFKKYEQSDMSYSQTNSFKFLQLYNEKK